LSIKSWPEAELNVANNSATIEKNFSLLILIKTFGSGLNIKGKGKKNGLKC